MRATPLRVATSRSPLRAFADLKNLAVRQPVAGRVARAIPPANCIRPSIVEAHPNPAPAVLEHRVRRVARQPFRLSVHHENVVAPPAQTAIRANPKVALAIFEQAAHHIAVLRIVLARADEAVALQPRNPVVRPRPDVAVAVRPHGAHRRVRQPFSHAVLLNRAARRPPDDSLAAAATRCRRRDPPSWSAPPARPSTSASITVSNLPPRAPHHAAEARHPQIVIGVFAHRPRRAHRNIDVGPVIRESPVLVAAQVQSRHHPQRALVVR